MSDEPSRTTADVIELEARRKAAAPEQPKAPEWTLAQARRFYAPAFKSLPFIQRKSETSICERPITFWNDVPGFDHKTDFKRGRLFAEMTIEAIAADNCGSGPLEATFEQSSKMLSLARPKAASTRAPCRLPSTGSFGSYPSSSPKPLRVAEAATTRPSLLSDDLLPISRLPGSYFEAPNGHDCTSGSRH